MNGTDACSLRAAAASASASASAAARAVLIPPPLIPRVSSPTRCIPSTSSGCVFRRSEARASITAFDAGTNVNGANVDEEFGTNDA